MKSTLTERAVLTSLKLRGWSARKADAVVTNKVAKDYRAVTDIGRYSKRILPKHSLAEVEKIAANARATFKFFTAPWLDDGTRILTTSGYDTFTERMRGFREEWDKSVAVFLKAYPDLIKEGKAELGDLFDEKDYPSVEYLETRFELNCRVFPVPDAKDFRADVSTEQAQMIRESIEEMTKEALAGATRDAYERIAEVVQHVAQKLADYKPDAPRAEQGIFRDSLIENVRMLVDTLPALNVADDPGLRDIADRVKQELCILEPQALREDAVARAQVQKAAADILNNVGGFI